MDTSLYSLLAQIPLVGIFIWFVLEMMKRYGEERTYRDTQWREFLKDLRDAQNAAIGRLAEEIKCIAIEVAQMRESLNRHEINTERHFSGLKRKGVEE
ncbi:MAG: hypothetical protein WHV66_04940 [Anaerolineales bacterium]|jgi:Na+/phosphate symporter